MRAIRVHAPGGPDALQLEDLPDPEPRSGQVVMRLEAIGVNFIDIYHRRGEYELEPPYGIGMEGAGVVTAVGEGVERLRAGDRIAQVNTRGSYAELQAINADQVVKLPDAMDSRAAATVALQGMTAHYLAFDVARLDSDQTVLVHAGAGGVGRLLIQMVTRIGARVIATVGTDEKARIAAEAGADDTIVYTQVDFLDEVKRLTDGEGVEVVYDSVGKATFERSLDSLKPHGLLALYGSASGAPPPVDTSDLRDKGSLYVSRPSLAHYARTTDELERRAAEVFAWVQDGSLELKVDRELPLAEAAEAQRALESRETSGKVLLAP